MRSRSWLSLAILAVAIVVVAAWWAGFFGGPGAATLEKPVTSAPVLQSDPHPPTPTPPENVLPSLPPAPGVPARPEPGRLNQ